MKPAPFEYHAPGSIDEAVALRSELADDSVVLSGGQSLIPLLSLRVAFPGAVIDLGRVSELAGISNGSGAVTIGGMTRQRAVEKSETVAASVPFLAKALAHVGHVTIRNRGTLGGSIAHADPASELPAAALALDAEIVARSVRGERTIRAAEFFRGVFTTALEPDELLVAVRFPAMAAGTGSAFVEVARRHGDFAIVGAGAIVRRGSGGAIEDARLVFIGVDGIPVRARDAETALVGSAGDDGAIREAAQAAAARLNPGSDVHASATYRRRLAAVLATRALKEASA